MSGKALAQCHLLWDHFGGVFVSGAARAAQSSDGNTGRLAPCHLFIPTVVNSVSVEAGFVLGLRRRGTVLLISRSALQDADLAGWAKRPIMPACARQTRFQARTLSNAERRTQPHRTAHAILACRSSASPSPPRPRWQPPWSEARPSGGKPDRRPTRRACLGWLHRRGRFGVRFLFLALAFLELGGLGTPGMGFPWVVPR